MLMSNNLTPDQVIMVVLGVFVAFWLGYAAFESAKAKAFNEGYKRGRASLNVREIVK